MNFRRTLAALVIAGFSLGSPITQAAGWDWSGIIGTGQSLSVGEKGRPVLSTNQPYSNLKLSTGDLPWPIDPDNPNLALVPLTEPIGRLSPGYPSSWPENIAGETPHTAMADEISSLVHAMNGRDYVTVHSAVGENGQGMIYLKKGAPHVGLNGRSYQAAMIETKAITRMAKAAGKSYGVSAIIVTHGETDAGNTNYEPELFKLWEDYNADIAAISGQSRKIQMIISQQNSCADHSPSTQAQWRIGVDHPKWIVCSGPKYQYSYAEEGVHLLANGYRQLGEKYGQIYFERVVRGRDWQPLHPTRIKRSGTVITIRFHVPVSPLVWDSSLEPPHSSVDEWKAGKGFEVTSAAGTKVAISSAEISGDSVVISCASDPGPNVLVSYAMVGEKQKMNAPYPGTFRWGLLRDSDPFVGADTQLPQPNFCVAFEMIAP